MYFAKHKDSWLDYLLFGFYLLFFAWLVTRVKFFTRSGLTRYQLLVLFLVKVMCAIVYGLIGVYYSNSLQLIDTWSLHVQGLAEYKTLLASPGKFFASIFQDRYGQGLEGFFSSRDSWWNDLHGKVFVKLLAMVDVLTAGHYYINCIFFSFVSLFGPIALYRVFCDAYPLQKKLLLLPIFFVPSFLYWTSGIHRDGIVFAALAMITYSVYFGLKKGFSLKRFLYIFIGLLLLLFRNYLLVILFPALLSWLIAAKGQIRPLYTFLTVYTLFVVLFFAGRHLSPRLDFPQTVVEKQEDFFTLNGNSKIAVMKLQPTLGSFVKKLPEAMEVSMVRPFPTDITNIFVAFAVVETDLFLLLFLLFLFFHRPQTPLSSFVLFCLGLSFATLVTIGYTVNFLGALVRYRSIVLPFLATLLVVHTDWARVRRIIRM